MNKSFNERRKHVRIYRNFIISYREKNKSLIKYNVSQVNDISTGGMNFSTTYPLQKGDVIEIDMKIPFLSESVQVEGVVLECMEKVPGMIFMIRLQFQSVSQDVLDALSKIELYSPKDD